MEFWKFMFVPTILFLVIVAPMWISMHYRSVNRAARGLTREDRESVEHMLVTVDKLTDRSEALEYFCDQFRTALTENLDAYIAHYDEYIEKFRHS